MNLTITVLAIYTLSLVVVACASVDNDSKNNLPLKGVVLRVIDGDTLDVQLDSGVKDRVRLLAVDTPETRQANKAGEYGDIRDINCLKRWGTLSTHFSKEMLEGQRVQLVSETSNRRDIYDRLLAYVHLEDGDDFNRLLVENGFARVYEEGESQRETEYLITQENAVRNRTGLWHCLPH